MTWIYISYFQRASPSWRCRRKKILLNYKSDFQKKDISGILIASGPEWFICEGHRAFLKGHLPPEGVCKTTTTPRVLEINPNKYIYSENTWLKALGYINCILFQRASPSWRCREKNPKLLVRFSKESYLMNPYSIRPEWFICEGHRAFLKGLLPPEGVCNTSNRS